MRLRLTRPGLWVHYYTFSLLLLCLAVVSPRVAAEEALPERATVEARLAELRPDEGTVLGGVEQRDVDALEATLEAFDQLESVAEQLEALEQRLDEAPAELLRLERELLQEEEIALERSIAQLDDLALEELEYRQQEAVFDLQQLQDRLAEVNSRLLAAQTLPERAQQAISEAMQSVERTRRELDALEGAGAGSARLWQLQVERRLAELKLRFRQRELGSNTRLRELEQQRRDLLTQQGVGQEAELSLLQGVIDRKRRIASEQAIADAVRDDPLLQAGHPVLERAQQINRELSLELLRANDRHNEMVREGLAFRSQLDHVRQLQRSLNEQIEAIRGSLLLSRILREQRRSLPQVDAQGDLQDEIADLRLRQFDLVRHRDALRQSERLANQRLEEAGVEISQALVESLQGLYHSRRQLVDQLEQSYGSLLSAAIELQLNQQQLLETSLELRGTIDEQLFWVANVRALNLAWLRQLPANLVSEWREGEWRQLLPMHWRRPGPEALAGLPLVLLALGLLGVRRRIRRRLSQLHEQIGRLRSDSQAHTPIAVGLNALLALPGPLILGGIGLALAAVDANEIIAGLGETVKHLALAWAFIAWSRRLLVRDGVAMKHFYWPSAYVLRLRWLLGWLGVTLLPVLLIGTLTRDGEITLTTRPLALLLLFVGLLAMSGLLARLILAHTPFFGIKLFRLALGLIMAMVPLVLLGLIVSGYEYTALSLVGRFVITLYLLALWILVEASVVRGLAVAARRLAFRRALIRRRAQAQEGAEGALEVVEEPPLDMEQINQQSLRLSKLILLLGFALLLYLVWSDLLTVLGYLNNIAIWEAREGAGAELVTSALSVADIFTALLIFFLMLIMARNLPGLLEVMVLSRMKLKQGSAYAISALLSYTIVGTGLVVSLATLGVAWSQLQWLVAALGVGLGFGLQEIFANFVSGLIILFERPVRIGDTITLGNLTGTVNRIRIRATTVTDFDRKEIIIPNKTFVTDQLINWSLSDTVTRVVLNYRVAYGSEQALVHRLLYQVAEENERVLADPEPQVFFMSFGDGTLNFELRIYVNSLGDRLFATDELNCRVDALFAEHGIDIAFDQLDVWLHRADGAARRVQSVSPSPGQGWRHPPPGAGGDPGDIDVGDASDGGDADGGR